MLSQSSTSFQVLKNSSIKPKESLGIFQINSDSKRTAKSHLTFQPLTTPNTTAATLAAIPQTAENDTDSSSETTTKRLQNSIKICNLPSGYDCWEVLELFSKVGIVNEYRCENSSMILVFRSSESVYLARFFNNHQFGKLESLISLAPSLSIQDIVNKQFTPYIHLTNNLGNNNNNLDYDQRSGNTSLADLNDLPAIGATNSKNTNNNRGSMIRAASQTNILLTIPSTGAGTTNNNNINQAVSTQQINSQDLYSASFAVPASSQVSKSQANLDKQFMSRSFAHHSSMIPNSNNVSNRYGQKNLQSSNESYSNLAGTLKHSPKNNENNTNKRNNNLLHPRILTYSTNSNGGLLSKSKNQIEIDDNFGGIEAIRTEKKQKGFRRADLNASNVSSGSSQDQNLEKTRKKSRKQLEINGEEEEATDEDEDDVSSFNNTSNNHRFSMKPTIILNSNEKDGIFSSNSKINNLTAQPIQIESLSTEESLRKVLDQIEVPSIYQQHESHMVTPKNSSSDSKNGQVNQSTPEEDIYAYFIMRQSYLGVLFLLYIAYLTFFYVF